MRRSSVLFLLTLCAWSVLGFGCKPRADVSLIGPGGMKFSAPVVPETPYVSKKKAEDTVAKEVVDLRQILANLQRAQSYRSRLSTPRNNGNVVAELLFSRRGGLYGTLQTGDGLTSQLFIKDQAVYVRYATDTWQNVSGSEEAQLARTQLYQTLFVNADGTSRILLRDSAKVISVKDDPAGCKLYSIKQMFFQPDTIEQTLDICVKDTYPVRIKNTTPDASIEISYDRFDDPTILAETPVRQ